MGHTPNIHECLVSGERKGYRKAGVSGVVILMIAREGKESPGSSDEGSRGVEENVTRSFEKGRVFRTRYKRQSDWQRGRLTEDYGMDTQIQD